MSIELFHELNIKFKSELPGEKAHQEMAPIDRPISSFALKNASNIKESAVAIIIYPDNHQFHSILIQRPIYEGTHSGQIAFPGGKKEENDLHLEHTARRESFEEIGLPENASMFIKELTKVYIPVSNFVVYPFVFYIDSKPELIADTREVADIIHFPLEQLLDDENKSTLEINFSNGALKKEVPCFTIQNKKVWGATALILNELKWILK